MSTKKKFRVPHSFVIVFSIIIAAVLLTWIIPAGEYARVEMRMASRSLIRPSLTTLRELRSIRC